MKVLSIETQLTSRMVDCLFNDAQDPLRNEIVSKAKNYTSKSSVQLDEFLCLKFNLTRNSWDHLSEEYMRHDMSHVVSS